MSEGTKHDGGKCRLELVPADFIVMMTGESWPTYSRWDAIKRAKLWAEHDTESSIARVAQQIASAVGREEWFGAVGAVLMFGAEKYDSWNWAKGMAWSRLVGAMLRHLCASDIGDGLDPETGMPHLWHALCCAMFLYVYEKRGIGTDDRHRWPDIVVGVAAEDVKAGDMVAARVFIDGDSAADFK